MSIEELKAMDLICQATSNNQHLGFVDEKGNHYEFKFHNQIMTSPASILWNTEKEETMFITAMTERFGSLESFKQFIEENNEKYFPYKIHFVVGTGEIRLRGYKLKEHEVVLSHAEWKDKGIYK